MAVINISIFGASFFNRSAATSFVVPILLFLLGVMACALENTAVPQSLSQAMGLAFFLPTVNFVFNLDFMLKWQIADIGPPPGLGVPIPRTASIMENPGTGTNWVKLSSNSPLWGFLIIQIVLFPALAILVEMWLHGINKKRFNTAGNADTSPTAIEIKDLKKHYKPGFWRTVFCWCRRGKPVKAVDGLTLFSHKSQILCLLGPNGSGKTTTLDMIARFQKQTSGDIIINAPREKLGFCPQKNVLWPKLTVMQHL